MKNTIAATCLIIGLAGLIWSMIRATKKKPCIVGEMLAGGIGLVLTVAGGIVICSSIWP
jgi:hypothetical protein